MPFVSVSYLLMPTLFNSCLLALDLDWPSIIKRNICQVLICVIIGVITKVWKILRTTWVACCPLRTRYIAVRGCHKLRSIWYIDSSWHWAFNSSIIWVWMKDASEGRSSATESCSSSRDGYWLLWPIAYSYVLAMCISCFQMKNEKSDKVLSEMYLRDPWKKRKRKMSSIFVIKSILTCQVNRTQGISKPSCQSLWIIPVISVNPSLLS